MQLLLLSLTPRFCTHSSFVNVWSHPKEAFNLFLNWKKLGFHIKIEQLKKKSQNWKNSNSHTHFSFFVSFHLYRFGFSLLALLYWVMFLFFSKQIGCYFVCDSVHVIQEDGATTATSTFLRFKASLGLHSRLQRWRYIIYNQVKLIILILILFN